jgi:hypothetical protein
MRSARWSMLCLASVCGVGARAQPMDQPLREEPPAHVRALALDRLAAGERGDFRSAAAAFLHGRTYDEAVDLLLEAMEADERFAPGTPGHEQAFRALKTVWGGRVGERVTRADHFAALEAIARDPHAQSWMRNNSVLALGAVAPDLADRQKAMACALLHDGDDAVVSSALSILSDWEGVLDEPTLAHLRGIALHPERTIPDAVASARTDPHGFGFDPEAVEHLRLSAADVFARHADATRTLALLSDADPVDRGRLAGVLMGPMIVPPSGERSGPFWRAPAAIRREWIHELAGAMTRPPGSRLVRDGGLFALLYAARDPELIDATDLAMLRVAKSCANDPEIALVIMQWRRLMTLQRQPKPPAPDGG